MSPGNAASGTRPEIRARAARWLRPGLIAVFLGMGAAAAGWWALMPKGFPVGHMRFWMNQILPPVALAFAALGVLAALRAWDGVLKALTLIAAAAGIAAAATGRVLFPQSFTPRLLIPALPCLAASIVPAAAAWSLLERRASVWAMIACAIAGSSLGVFVPFSQRALDPATRPAGLALPPLPGAAVAAGASLPVAEGVSVSPGTGAIDVKWGEAEIRIAPLLTFHSRSPDRFWTLFARSADRRGPTRLLRGFERDGDSIALAHASDVSTFLKLGPGADGGSIAIASFARLQAPIYSHLNSYCELHLRAGLPVSVSFSPCPGDVEVTRFEYPSGRPARVAYLDAEGTFRIVEARSGEKGPFRTLREGPLGEEPLRMTLSARNRPICRITLFDWARQASTQLSPAAGWGLPENAIEFFLSAEAISDQASFLITLAGTSVGRGWDSVGHAAGVYRTTMLLERM
ncbi:MAG: hypothetical protein JXP34_04045 [Planctomycetes bacterium]|nr:hypothetical protein [Planctomycetota bacterium]